MERARIGGSMSVCFVTLIFACFASALVTGVPLGSTDTYNERGALVDDNDQNGGDINEKNYKRVHLDVIPAPNISVLTTSTTTSIPTTTAAPTTTPTTTLTTTPTTTPTTTTTTTTTMTTTTPASPTTTPTTAPTTTTTSTTTFTTTSTTMSTTTSTATTTTTTTTTTPKPVISVVSVTKKVEVTVVYESHCPYSRRFMYGQLLPTFQKLSNFMNLTILPFGKAHVDNVSAPVPHFTCQHGTNECMGNMIETCVVHVVKEQLKVVQIIACMSQSYQPHLAGQKCVESTGIKWSMVQECVTKKGTRYLLETGLKTWKIQSYVARVPLVVVDGEMDNYVEYYAQKNFMKIMCEHLASNGYSISPCASAEK